MHTEMIQHNAIHSVVLCWNHPLMLWFGRKKFPVGTLSGTFKMFRYSFKSTMEQELSWVIVVVWLLTKHTEWIVCGDKQPSTLLDGYNDRSASFSLSQFPEPDATSQPPQIWARADDVSVDPLSTRLVWRRHWETADRHNGLYLRSGSCAGEMKSLIPLCVNRDLMFVLSLKPTCQKRMCWIQKWPQQ